MNTLFGFKSAMSSRYTVSGKRLTVTAVTVVPHVVVGYTPVEKVGYSAVILGFGSKRKAPKAEVCTYQHLSFIPRYVREVRDSVSFEPGTVVSSHDVFAPGDVVSVTGISKGKGFTGVVKRHNFRGGPKTHGQSDRHRAPGSVGAGTTPGRVFPGLRMAGRSGGAVVTVRNLVVLHVHPDSGEILLSGPIPGHRNSLVKITKTGKKVDYSPIELLVSDVGVSQSDSLDDSLVTNDMHVDIVEEKVSE